MGMLCKLLASSSRQLGEEKQEQYWWWRPSYFLSTEGPSWDQGKNTPQIFVYKHMHAHTHARARTHTHTHTLLYRYWPGVQDMPAEEAESKFNFWLPKNPN